jgi:hypothetical protein
MSTVMPSLPSISLRVAFQNFSSMISPLASLLQHSGFYAVAPFAMLQGGSARELARVCLWHGMQRFSLGQGT